MKNIVGRKEDKMIILAVVIGYVLGVTPFLFFYILNKKKKAIFILLQKIFYLPVIFISYAFFNIKGALFAVPLCDIIYTIFLIYNFKNRINK